VGIQLAEQSLQIAHLLLDFERFFFLPVFKNRLFYFAQLLFNSEVGGVQVQQLQNLVSGDVFIHGWDGAAL
jgi:hypothetical protein